MTPEEALTRARAAAAERRASGGDPDPALAPAAVDTAVPTEEATLELLREWAVIHVDPASVFSTRRFGAPMTLLKRLLMRLMRQYIVQLEASQSRFNVALLAHVEELELRLEELERRTGER